MYQGWRSMHFTTGGGFCLVLICCENLAGQSFRSDASGVLLS